MTIAQHIIVRIVRNGENMGRHFILSFSLIDTNHVVIVNGQPFVGVDRDTEKARVSVDHETLVTLREIINYCRLGQVGHVGQVFQELVLGRILVLKLRFLYFRFPSLYSPTIAS